MNVNLIICTYIDELKTQFLLQDSNISSIVHIANHSKTNSVYTIDQEVSV